MIVTRIELLRKLAALTIAQRDIARDSADKYRALAEASDREAVAYDHKASDYAHEAAMLEDAGDESTVEVDDKMWEG